MDVRQAYNTWAPQYDINNNKTRDLEGKALQHTLANTAIDNCLEIGCGTGKNTQWLAEKARYVTAVDFSEEMLARAREKVIASHVRFVQADITGAWLFTSGPYNLITFSLVLEHIADLDHVFAEASKVLAPGGLVYLGELHPYKQYNGTKARFDTEAGRHIVECYNHHISDFIATARKHGLHPVDVDEYFDDDDRTNVPRILMILLKG